VAEQHLLNGLRITPRLNAGIGAIGCVCVGPWIPCDRRFNPRNSVSDGEQLSAAMCRWWSGASIDAARSACCTWLGLPADPTAAHGCGWRSGNSQSTLHVVDCPGFDDCVRQLVWRTERMPLLKPSAIPPCLPRKRVASPAPKQHARGGRMDHRAGHTGCSGCTCGHPGTGSGRRTGDPGEEGGTTCLDLAVTATTLWRGGG